MRPALFLLALAAAFGAAVAAGGAFGPEPAEPEAAAGTMGGHDGAPSASGAHASAGASPGLAAAEGGLALVVSTPELTRGRAGTLRFRVLDAHGRPVRSFDVAHERRMHAIVVRRDLSGFQHVHPRMEADGTWVVPLRLDASGSYRLYADFTHAGERATLATDLRVDGDADLRPLPAPAAATRSDGGDVVRLGAAAPRAGRATTLRFALTREGRPVAAAPYLGAAGHLVALREGDLAFLHVHPLGDDAAAHGAPDGEIAFGATFPSAGRYRLFLQYRVAGAQVRTAAFTLEVTP